MAGTMRAVVFERCGGPEVLELRAGVPVPAPGPGQVMVKVLAAGGRQAPAYRHCPEAEGAFLIADGGNLRCNVHAGVNPVDCLVRKGFFGMAFLMPKLKIPGGDLAGVVQEGAGDVRLQSSSMSPSLVCSSRAWERQYS